MCGRGNETSSAAYSFVNCFMCEREGIMPTTFFIWHIFCMSSFVS